MSYDTSHPRTTSDLWQDSRKKRWLHVDQHISRWGVFHSYSTLQLLTEASARPATAPASACFPYPKQQSHLISQCSSLAFGASPFVPGRPGSPFGPEAPGIPGHPWRTASRSASPSPTILTSEEMKTAFVEIIRALKCLGEETEPSGVQEQCK